MNRDTFSGCHPLVNLLFFGAVLGLTMFLMHPVCLVISLVCGTAYLIYLRGRKGAFVQIGYLIPLLLLMAVLNPLFNHEGSTVLVYLPNDNPLTLEAVCFGINASVMMGASVIWFNCCSTVFTSDKIIYVFGRIIPAMSLMISMTLRFVPRFKNHLRAVWICQRALTQEIGTGGQLRLVISAFSATISWAMEQAIVSADSMKSRGYGLKGRTAFSIYRFDGRDRLMAAVIVILFLSVVLLAAGTGLKWTFYPAMTGNLIGIKQATAYVCLGGLYMLPLVLNLSEDRKWNSLRSKI